MFARMEPLKPCIKISFSYHCYVTFRIFNNSLAMLFVSWLPIGLLLLLQSIPIVAATPASTALSPRILIGIQADIRYVSTVDKPISYLDI